MNRLRLTESEVLFLPAFSSAQPRLESQFTDYKKEKYMNCLFYLYNETFEAWTGRNLTKLQNKVSILISLTFGLKDGKTVKRNVTSVEVLI